MMRQPYAIASFALCAFFVATILVGWIYNDLGIVRVVGGENSVGSWLSGVLLVISATTSGFMSVERKKYVWLLACLFFLTLAIDENFMLHEYAKRTIVFTDYNNTTDSGNELRGEIPVMIGALIGAFAAYVLWRITDRRYRWLIPIGVLLGTASVVMDIFKVGVLWEDSCKLLGELAVTCCLVLEYGAKRSES